MRQFPPMISAKALGAMPQFVLEAAGSRALDRALIRAELPHRFISQRDGYIPENSLATFVSSAARSVGYENIGLLWAPSLTVADYGAWGRYVLSAPTLGSALRRSERAMPFHSSTDKATLNVPGTKALMRYQFGLPDHPAYTDIAFLAIGAVLSIFRSYLGSTWSPDRIHVDRPQPPHGESPEATFGCPCHWNSHHLAIEFASELLQTEAPALDRVSPATIQDIARERQSGPPKTFAGRAEAVIRLQVEENRVSIDNAAMALDTGVRTMQRRLAAENTSFRSLTNRLLIGRAKELILQKQYTTTQIASHLGYNSSNNFSRAFKEQTGLTPTQFWKLQQD